MDQGHDWRWEGPSGGPAVISSSTIPRYGTDGEVWVVCEWK